MKFQQGQIVVNATNAGPVPVMINSLTQMARSGALDQALVTGHGFYTTDYTKPLLFLADGEYFATLAQKQHLTGDQWGMMNETGQYPGQAWLWLYTFWYQIPPFNTSANADVLVLGTHGRALGPAALRPLHPGSALDPPQDQGLPHHLARALPGLEVVPGPSTPPEDHPRSSGGVCSLESTSSRHGETYLDWPTIAGMPGPPSSPSPLAASFDCQASDTSV